MRRESRRKPGERLLLIVLLMGMVMVACSGEDSGAESFEELSGDLATGAEEEASATTAAAAEGAADASEGAEEPENGGAEVGTGGITPTVLQTSDLGRDIIFTADLTVAVPDVATAGEDATQMIQSLGGFLFGQRTTGAPESTSVLTFKVQPQDFPEALSRLGTIGELRTQNVTADDVTERIVDLESRINTATTSVERLRGLLAGATDIKTIVDLENQLLERETQLETLRGQLRTLQDQVGLATIVLTLTEAASRPEVDLAVTAYPGHDDGLSCPGNSELAVEQNTEATVCFEIVNAGDTWLSVSELRDPVLDLEMEDLIVVFGDPTRAIEPGEAILLAAEVVVPRSLRTRTTVTAQPVDEEGDPFPGRPTASTISILIEGVDPGGIPSFAEGLEGSWNVLVRLVQVLVLLTGALVPFFWVPLLVWLVWRLRRPRTTDSSSDTALSATGGSEES